jgi:hypothetical protein
MMPSKAILVVALLGACAASPSPRAEPPAAAIEEEPPAAVPPAWVPLVTDPEEEICLFGGLPEGAEPPPCPLGRGHVAISDEVRRRVVIEKPVVSGTTAYRASDVEHRLRAHRARFLACHDQNGAVGGTVHLAFDVSDLDAGTISNVTATMNDAPAIAACLAGLLEGASMGRILQHPKPTGQIARATVSVVITR